MKKLNDLTTLEFQATNRWFKNFKHRQTQNAMLVGALTSTDHKFLSDLTKIIEKRGYVPYQVSSADGTGLALEENVQKDFSYRN